MFELIFIFLIVFAILTFFYKQSVCEYRINQTEWPRRKENMPELFQENVPIILRNVPQISLWTSEDIMMRDCYSTQFIESTKLADWIVMANTLTACPWTAEYAGQLGNMNGLSIWAEKWINSELFQSTLKKLWLRPSYACWAGERGLYKTSAPWTCLFVSEGAIQVSLMTPSMEYALPSPWKGCFPMRLTNHDTPFVSELKVLDVIVRPGSCLLVPSHWFMSWCSLGGEQICPMTCTISYHSPLSRFADFLERRAKK